MSHELFGVRIDDVSPVELQKMLVGWLVGDQERVIVTPNAEFLLEARRDSTFVDLLNRSDLAIADAVSLQYAVAALGDHQLVSRIPGVDLLTYLCKLAVQHHVRVLLLGGDTGAAEASAQKLQQQLESLDVIALDPGRISWKGKTLFIDNALLEYINHTGPSIVAVALGQHKQEQFIDQLRNRCPSVRIWIGVGGALEMISGQKRRAPHMMSRVGLEWLWRLIIEPRRVRRILQASFVFPLVVAREALRRGTLLRSTRHVFSEFYRQWFVYER